MLQSSDYQYANYIAWWLRTTDFRSVMYRQTLTLTAKSSLLLALLRFLYIVGILIITYFAWQFLTHFALIDVLIMIITFLLWPTLMAVFVIPVIWVGEVTIQKPRERRLIAEATAKSNSITGLKIAIVGSYGKTSMKEMLKTILSEKLIVRATPGNKNTPLGTSEFIGSLKGDEDVVIFEMGESHVGDISELCEIIKPNKGIITGISEAHLETFGTVQNLENTIFEVVDFLGDGSVYKNIDSEYITNRVANSDPLAYSKKGVHDWVVSDIDSTLHGLKFVVNKGSKTIWVDSQLVGEHHVGPLVACIDIADKLGLSLAEIAEGIQQTKAFEHRMQPYHLHGALVIDDTYNGNPSGIYSGLKLLREADAKRRVYVTPGLVELGHKSAGIHEYIGQQIAVSADVVVLMKNSTTKFIEKGLSDGAFSGELLIVDNPLRFYQNLDQFVAMGDVVLMQNDWTDNYA
jgi:UDP-N-acetylmuramoyl-tripeptide--D-alanyl-D-alanine ligase